MEYAVLDFLQTIHTKFLDAIMVFITSLGDAGILWIFIALILLVTKKYRKYGMIIAASLLLGLLIGNILLKNLVGRERPFASREDIELLIHAPRDFSFPSCHTLSSFAAAGSIYYMNKRWGLAALIIAALIGLSRLYLYVHFVTDVLAGMLIGLLIAYAMTKVAAVKFHVFPLDHERKVL